MSNKEKFSTDKFSEPHDFAWIYTADRGLSIHIPNNGSHWLLLTPDGFITLKPEDNPLQELNGYMQDCLALLNGEMGFGEFYAEYQDQIETDLKENNIFSPLQLSARKLSLGQITLDEFMGMHGNCKCATTPVEEPEAKEEIIPFEFWKIGDLIMTPYGLGIIASKGSIAVSALILGRKTNMVEEVFAAEIQKPTDMQYEAYNQLAEEK